MTGANAREIRRRFVLGAIAKRAPAAGPRRLFSAIGLILCGLIGGAFTASAESPLLGRGVNILADDPIWTDPRQARFQRDDFARIQQGGFSTIRVNLQAFAHMDDALRLEPRWLSTLDWVVREAEAAGLAVILDEHDSSPCAEDVAACRTKLMAFWQQLADRYRNAPASVLFEVLNEPHGRMTPDLWNGVYADVLAVVRRSDPTRFVVIGPGDYNDAKALKDLVLPDQDRHLLVTVHYYQPFPFTHQGAAWTTPSREKLLGVTWGTPDDYAAVERDFDAIAAWSQRAGRPILLGEFGAYDMADMISRVAWTSCVARAAERHAMSWSYWQFDRDFVVFDMKRQAWVKPIHDALVPP